MFVGRQTQRRSIETQISSLERQLPVLRKLGATVTVRTFVAAPLAVLRACGVPEGPPTARSLSCLDSLSRCGELAVTFTRHFSRIYESMYPGAASHVTIPLCPLRSSCADDTAWGMRPLDRRLLRPRRPSPYLRT